MPECQVELIPVEGLLHLFSPSCEEFLRQDYLEDTRDIATQVVFKAEDLEFDTRKDLIGRGAFSEVFKVTISNQSRTAALKVFWSGLGSVHNPSVLSNLIVLFNVLYIAEKQISNRSRKS